MVRRRTTRSEKEGQGGVGRNDRTRERRDHRGRRTWRRVVEGASELVEGLLGARGPAPRPVVVPIPVRTTRRARRDS